MYRLAIDGDDEEKLAWGEFLQAQFPEYELFWQKAIVPLTERPLGIQLRDDPALPAPLGTEDIVIAQLHYTVLRNLRRAYHAAFRAEPDEYSLTLALAFVVAAQDNACELLERHRNRGVYDFWLERRSPGKKPGLDARAAWLQAPHPLKWVRDYRNKMLHGRIPPAIEGKLPKPGAIDKYVDWRVAFKSGATADFESPQAVAAEAWKVTLEYFREMWRTHLL
jgi:hypothetical protein